MKISSIKINNFRQYFGEAILDLNTSNNKNIILIGGKNGYGKTNFLLSLVWCLYGDKISQVDDNFKKEIQKEKNYSQFMKQSLNWDAQKANEETFSIELHISNLELPDLTNDQRVLSEIAIKRQFNVKTMVETLSIQNPKTKKHLFDDEIDKVNFINDYIIPLDAAKFVFFDAEKIAALAELSTREEGNILNDALGKILGLDIYEDLIDDLEYYSVISTRESASGNIQEQIIDRENAIKITNNQIDQLEERNGELFSEVERLKADIRSFNNFINQHSIEGKIQVNRELIITKKLKIEEKISELEEKFNELSELIPFTIFTGQLEDIKDHLELQHRKSNLLNGVNELAASMEVFIERLFNHPPEAPNSTFTLKDKIFYYDKAMNLSKEVFNNESDEVDLKFEHDLNNTEKELVLNALNYVNIQSKELFETTIDNYNSLNLELIELDKTLGKIDADLEDELIIEYLTKKEKSERQLNEHNQLIGINKEKINRLTKDISRLNQQYQSLLQKIEITQKNKLKILRTNEYINVLKLFVNDQKELKKDSLAKNILDELQKLMHKLNKSKHQFVSDVQVTILAEGGGMKITLYNPDGEEIKKEVLSQGEKQLYISSLIKAILKESIQSLPIFIDTPLGRLDDEHIKNILLYYYPDLSDQVVILSTNNEITPRRLSDITEYVSKTYLLEHHGGNTSFKSGYFKTA